MQDQVGLGLCPNGILKIVNIKIMNKLDTQYLHLLEKIVKEGDIKHGRNGDTQSIFGYQIRHNMCEGFPLLTTKKVHFKGIVTELLWFLRGDTNIRYLVENGCNIWNGDAFKKFKMTLAETATPACSPETFAELIKTDAEFAQQWGELGPVYGKQWRNWSSVAWDYKYRQVQDSVHNHHDQIKTLIKDLKNNPDSRRLMVNAWNVGEIDRMVLPPCHYGFQCYTTELTTEERVKICLGTSKFTQYAKDGSKIWYGPIPSELNEQQLNERLDSLRVPKRILSLMWNQRSVDTPLGLPFNIASYGLLLMILAKYVNMVPGQLIGNLGDTHIYLNQMEGVKEQLTREAFPLPQVYVAFKGDKIEDISEYQIEDIVLLNYQSQPKINFPLSN
jgi:thymidylate synthase